MAKHKRFVGFSCLVVVGWCAVFSLPTLGQDQPTLDELLDLVPTEAPSPTPGGADAPSADAATESTETTPVVEGIDERLTGEQIADAFESAVNDMARVADRLDAGNDPGLDTQRLQESILARLDQLIEAAQQQQSSSSSSSGGKPSSNQDGSAQNAGQQPGSGQQPSPGQAGAGENNTGGFSPGSVGPVEPGQGAIDEVRSEWGALPPRLRDELTNGLDEPYSPVYRRLTEAYYRRLAEEAGQ